MSTCTSFTHRFLSRAIGLAHLPLLAAIMGSALPAAAQSAPGGDAAPASSWALGVAAISQKKAYTGMDRDNMALPFIQYENRFVSIIGPQIGFKLLSLDLAPTQTLDFDLVAKYDGSGYEDDDIRDTPILNGMHERKSGFWAGARVEWETDWVTVSADALADASGNSKGRQFNLGVEKTWHIGERWMITPRVVANWRDKKYNDYYYGVRSGEARAGRAAYLGKSGVNAEVGVRTMYQFDERHSAFVDLEFTRVSNAVKDSPLVDRSTENRVFLGYLYRFK